MTMSVRLFPLPGQEQLGVWLLRYSIVSGFKNGCAGVQWYTNGDGMEILWWEDIHVGNDNVDYGNLIDCETLDKDTAEVLDALPKFAPKEGQSSLLTIGGIDSEIALKVFNREDSLIFVLPKSEGIVEAWTQLELPDNVAILDAFNGMTKSQRGPGWRVHCTTGEVAYGPDGFLSRSWRYWIHVFGFSPQV